MNESTEPRMDERALPRLTAGYMDACKGKPADHNEIGLHYFMAGWVAGREAMAGRASQSVPSPVEDKDGVAKILVDFALGKGAHLNNGLCPDFVAGFKSRDPDCKICAAIDRALAQEGAP